MYRKLAVLGLAATAAAALTVSPSHATSTQQEHFKILSANHNDRDLPAVFYGHGAIHGVGRVASNDDVSGDHVPMVVTLPGGKVFMTAHEHFQWVPDRRTCTATEHDRGTIRVTGGTGEYAGATGSLTYSEYGAGIGRRDSAGNCRQSFAINYVVVNARGTVTS